MTTQRSVTVLEALLAVALCLLASAALVAEDVSVLRNGRFEEGLDENGVPKHWAGNADRLTLVEAEGMRPSKVLRIAKGSRISQVVQARGGQNYVFSVRARTDLVEERADFRYRSYAYLYLAFLPSGKKFRTEMITPFGDSSQSVEYAVGGVAPEGTESVEAIVVAGPSEIAVDDARLVVHGDTYEDFKLKELCLGTAIVEDGKPAANIVVPASGIYDELGRRIASKIRSLASVEVPIVSDAAFELCAEQRLSENLIVLGNRNTNQVVSDLYDLYYCIIDLRYPGKSGSVVRSLHDPFGDTHNVIFVGASDGEGMEKATASFVGALDDAERDPKGLKVGHLTSIELGSDVNIPATMGFRDLRSMKPWDATNRTGGYGWTVITKAMAYYYLTGYEFYAREFLRLAFSKDAQTYKDLESCGQDFRRGRDKEPLVDVYHYRAHLPVVYWDLIEESPVFSDEDRVRVTLQFMKQTRMFRENTDYGCKVDKQWYPPASISSRHHQWGAMTFYTLGRYLSKYYPDYEWKAVKRSAEYFFAPLYMRRHVWNRGESARLARYPTTLAAPFAYSLMSGNKRPVEIGSLQDQARNMEILLDWKRNAWVLRQAPTSLFNQMAYLLRERRYSNIRKLTTTAAKFLRPGQSYWPDESNLPLNDFGIRRWETLEPTSEELHFWGELWGEPLPQQERMFRLTSFRTANDGKGDYALFDGVYLGGVYHCFSLLEYVLNGDILFMGHRSHVNFSSDGMTAAKQPKYSLLDRASALGDTAFIKATIPQYNFVDWERSLLHRSGQYGLVVDVLTSLEDTSFGTAEINWGLDANASAVQAAPGSVVIEAEVAEEDVALLDFCALGDGSTVFDSNLPADKVLRSSYNAVTLLNHDKGSWLTVTFDVEREVEGEMIAEFVRGRNRGLVKVELDGTALMDQLDCHSPGSQKLPVKVELGRRRLRAGRHCLRLESLGPSPQSTDAFISFRGFRLVGSVETRSYLLSCSQKLKTTIRDLGTAVGSAAAGGCVSTIWSGAAPKGRELRFFSLVAPRTGAVDDDTGGCIGVGPNAAVLSLPGGAALAVSGTHESFEALAAVAGSDHLSAYAATRCGGFLSSDQPVDIDWDFSTGRVALQCSSRCDVELAVGTQSYEIQSGAPLAATWQAGRLKLALNPGLYRFRNTKPDARLVEAHRRNCEALLANARTRRLTAPITEPAEVQVTAPRLNAMWRTSVGTFPMDLHVFQHQDRAWVAAAVDNRVVLLDDQGRVVRKLEADAPVKVMHFWPETGLLTVGCRDFKVLAYDPVSGDRCWVFESTDINPIYKKSGFTAWCDRNPPENRGIHALSSGTFLDGRCQLLVGTACTVEALDQRGRLMRSVLAGAGVVTDLALLPHDDGEVILLPGLLFGRYLIFRTSSRSPERPTYSFTGAFAPRRGASTFVGEYGGGYLDIEVCDLDGDGGAEVVGLFNGALNGIHVWGDQGNIVADAAFGDGRASPKPSLKKEIPALNMRGLAVVDLNGDGEKELCVITARGFLIVLNADCEKMWAKRLPSEPLTITAFGARDGAKGYLIVGCRGRGLYRVNADGKFAAQARLSEAPVKAARLRDGQVVIATSEGEIIAYAVE